MPGTIYHVARLAGVSTATVSRVINGGVPVSPATRQRVMDAVRELGYRPNALARSLASGQTRTVALLLPDITNPFFPELVKGVQLVADEDGYTLILCETAGDPVKEASYLTMLRGQQVDGLIAIGLTLPRDRTEQILGPDLPVVCLDRSMDLRRASQVHVDHRQGARLATEHLLALGHRRIAHIAGPPGLRVSAARREAYQLTLREAGVRPDRSAIVEGDLTEDGGYAATLRLLERPGSAPTAVFVANDLMAIGAMAALRARGVGVPGDLSVVGFDDIHLAAYTSPPLTTVHQPAREMARRATEILLAAIGSPHDRRPRRAIFDATLVVRGSSAAP